jgi:hypothetical protein
VIQARNEKKVFATIKMEVASKSASVRVGNDFGYLKIWLTRKPIRTLIRITVRAEKKPAQECETRTPKPFLLLVQKASKNTRRKTAVRYLGIDLLIINFVVCFLNENHTFQLETILPSIFSLKRTGLWNN